MIKVYKNEETGKFDLIDSDGCTLEAFEQFDTKEEAEEAALEENEREETKNNSERQWVY